MNQSRRLAKASQAIKQIVSLTILSDLRDPRIQNVTVLAAEAAADMKTAKVYISVMGDAKAEALSIHGLNSAKGYLQSKIADRLQTRNTPVLQFVIDQGVKRSVETSRVLNEVHKESSETASGEDQDLSADRGGEWISEEE